MAKQLAFNQSSGQRAAVDFDHHAVFSFGQIVEGARDQLLARAGFAEQQDGRISCRDHFDVSEHFLHRLGSADHLAETQLAAQFFLETRRGKFGV